jgi:hypothetical protein
MDVPPGNPAAAAAADPLPGSSSWTVLDAFSMMGAGVPPSAALFNRDRTMMKFPVLLKFGSSVSEVAQDLLVTVIKSSLLLGFFPMTMLPKNQSRNIRLYVGLFFFPNTFLPVKLTSTVRWSNFDRLDPKMGVFLQSTEATPCGHVLK